MRTGTKVVLWAVGIFFAWYLFTQPTAAGHTVYSLLNMLGRAGSSITTFFSSIK